MNPSIVLVEKIRETTAKKTNYATAKALGISQSNLSQILLGERGLGVESCVRAAEILRVPVEHVIAEIFAHSAKTPEKRAFWEKRLPRVLPTLVIWASSVGVTLVTYEAMSSALTTASHFIHYAQSLFNRTVRRTAFGLVRYAHKMVYKVRSAELIFRPFTVQAITLPRSILQ